MALTVIRGLPGSGKTHYAKNNFGGALVLEGDQRFVDVDGSYKFGSVISDKPYLADMVATAFDHGLKHVIVTTSHGEKRVVDDLADVARRYGHETRVMWLDCLNGEGLNDHDVPPDVIDKMKHTWELYPGETYARRIPDGYGSGFSRYDIKLVDTPPPWYTETHKASKVIFLDVDGVLNPNFEVEPGKEFYPEMMDQLKKLVDSTGAAIVLSSTWGYTKESRKRVADELLKYDLELYANIYQYNNVTFMKGDSLADKDIVIYAWLKYHPEVTHYVVLDDWDYSDKFPGHFIRTFDPAQKRYGLDFGYSVGAGAILKREE